MTARIKGKRLSISCEGARNSPLEKKIMINTFTTLNMIEILICIVDIKHF